ncbi:hypothetical protein N7492_000726 [Penicillium capsulatum]|uniref:Uncharacterized protein n=1 Tax=Penicillium capsulatum TaxID=69766 RepID=A0A9W9IQZ3_9EURO|nr:hypothetical protein N7492_000726 [Penicillium capsulatum]KAJ6130215.1 hypothetical protein N7512_002995 [Penicillium capsulatum]
MVGKRKRETAVISRSKNAKDASPSPADSPADNAQDVFRKYFEAQFEPLDVPNKPMNNSSPEKEDGGDSGDDSEVSESGTDRDGLSEASDDSNQVEVVEHKAPQLVGDRMDKQARKAFMNAKPPSSLDNAEKKPAKSNTKDEEEDDAADAENLKHDLALQRLLKESHLLDSAEELAPTGKNRLKALDLRMQSLGAKTSLYDQQKKMPTAHRRGINAKAASKEDKRRREAKENGIVLEKPNKVTKSSNNGRRDRGIGGSSIGKFSGGTLNLSKQDLISMKSSKSRPGKGKGKTGRR